MLNRKSQAYEDRNKKIQEMIYEQLKCIFPDVDHDQAIKLYVQGKSRKQLNFKQIDDACNIKRAARSHFQNYMAAKAFQPIDKQLKNQITSAVTDAMKTYGYKSKSKKRVVDSVVKKLNLQQYQDDGIHYLNSMKKHIYNVWQRNIKNQQNIQSLALSNVDESPSCDNQNDENLVAVSTLINTELACGTNQPNADFLQFSSPPDLNFFSETGSHESPNPSSL